MTRNILELKSMDIPFEEVQSLDVARQSPNLKGFDFQESFFETVFHPMDYVKNYPFYVRKETHEDVVRVENIVGTTHESYYGKNWLAMLMSLKRHRSDYDINSVIAAINDTRVADRRSLSKYGDAYFIDGGGNHRVCQAKILNLETVPCEVTEFVFNEDAFSKPRRLNAIREIEPSFAYQPCYDNESIISVHCLGILVSLHFCDKEIAVLERVIYDARKTERNPIMRVWNRMLSRFSGTDNFSLYREECIKPLCRELTVRMGKY